MARPVAQLRKSAGALISVISLACMPAIGQDRVEVRAAIEAARADLRGQILAMPVAPGVSVRQLVETNPSVVRVDDLVGEAERVGQPRWVEQDIVQVKMSLPADKVVDQVNAIPLQQRPSTVSQSDVDRLRRDWSRRSLQSTGQAIPAARVADVVSSINSNTWRDVPADARTEAADRARFTATSSLVEQTASLRIGSTETLGGNFLNPDARQKLSAWANTLPATRVVLRDDRQVEIAVYVDKHGLGQQVRSVAASELTSQADKMAALDLGIARLPSVVVGRAALGSPETAAQQRRPAMTIRGAAPAWANESITVEANAASTGNSRLRTARAAEKRAVGLLQQKVMQLKLDDGATTLEQAASRDERVGEAVTRAMGRARTYQVDYNPDGSATVRMTLDPNDLLDELTASR